MTISEGKLTAIDSDHMFGSPVRKRDGKYMMALKNLLFTLPILPHEEIDREVRERLLHLSPDLVVLQWLTALRKHNQHYVSMGMNESSLHWGEFCSTSCVFQ